MNKFLQLACIIFTTGAFSQTVDYTRAPNSFVYDINLSKTQNYGGIYIPVKKAYEMWAKHIYLKSGGVPTPIPAGTQTASLYWEDQPGLVTEVGIVPDPDPSLSKIKVNINHGVGKGNAVVAFKVNGVVYWSWHIWVTDDPSKGVNYTHGFETNIDNQLIQVEYMDRNLGASAKSFLGENWEKSGGLMYEWGRKDPFPPLVYKDFTFYEINSELGSLKHKQVSAETIPVVLRPANEIETNIRYAVNNPLHFIINTDANNWFSSSRHRVSNADGTYTAWDLWADNYRGGASNASSSNTALAKDSRSYELKSEFDPCPSGWRIPSHYGRVTMNNNHSPWGRHSGTNDDATPAANTIYPDSKSLFLDGIKVYPGLGMDFTNAQGGGRNIGIMPMPGGYIYYPNSVSPTAAVGTIYQDENASGAIWSATYGYDGARPFYLISDAGRTNTVVGLHAIYINQTNTTKSGNAVRCMKDPNILKIGTFPTEYFTSPKTNFTEGLGNPNTYLVTNQTNITIPVNKAFAVYNQILTDREMLPGGSLVAKVLWTTNPKMVKAISMYGMGTGASITVEIDPMQKGNAVISLHNSSTDTPAYWSWLIWNPNGNPASRIATYLTETPIPTAYNFVNPTKSTMPSIVTTFMDRNLGAVEAFQDSTNPEFIEKTKGLLFQWGRKDPIPAFAGVKDPNSQQVENVIYLGSENQTSTGNISFTKINDAGYLSSYTKEFQTYKSTNPNKYRQTVENIKYSVENPLQFLYKQGTGKLFDGGNKYSNDLTQVRDWAAADRAQAADRWGHADKKSVFDPCPAGWRVPDVSYSALYFWSKGNSPFYNSYKTDWTGKPGIIQDQWADIMKSYVGQVYNNGWAFTHSTYPIGSYTKDGIRGELGGNAFSKARSGVWSASLADLRSGFGLAMLLQDKNMQAGTGVYPQAAMSVRCAKDETRLLGEQPTFRNQSLSLPAMINPAISTQP